jgi:hypothetical protein
MLILSLPKVIDPTLLQRLKCESEGENNKRKSWGTLPNSQHLGGRRGMLELRDGD